MIFVFEGGFLIRDSRTIYNKNEFSVVTEPFDTEVCHTILVNYLEINFRESGYVSEINGLLGGDNWNHVELHLPSYEKGLLKIEGEFTAGISKRVNDEQTWPVYFDKKSNWICVGDYSLSGQSIEFLKGCIATISNGRLTALWISLMQTYDRDLLLKYIHDFISRCSGSDWNEVATKLSQLGEWEFAI